ncbi:UDP-N-acetylmuramoylalanine--D-glutamate ligase [Desulfonema limicola]|uniref:UDP-N-acetylmuramoylalanine--D-glutamate ligase n=1 Tax=Desulfonema limicola TaxID=45656 RepID=A0A975BB30_9BACT|nr:UDP-N-acetylmuramoyl-L-alanine--D-glutamate ligase [Desulfonema limicola]QTA82086.1 UDP-N-acetylmuramoylalanine--D-glutamate ligase [Desulfonema limicola]
MKKIDQNNILIAGFGRSGLSCARFLKNIGKSVTITDQKDEHAFAEYIPEIKELGIRLELGHHSCKTFENAEMIVLSPGVPHTLKPILRAKAENIPVIGEIELASRFISEPVTAVTGTNGKTTTTTLLGEMLKESGLDVFVGGNIGTPLIEYPAGKKKSDRLVVEISSFQLDTIQYFRPDTAVLLNITQDHLDRYDNFDAYVKSKSRIFENQKKDDTAVFNGDDLFVRSISHKVKSSKFFINPKIEEQGIIINYNNLILESGKYSGIKFDLSKVKLPGRHNQENMAAACMAALASGGTPEGIQSALNNFKGLAHRIEYAAVIDNVKYYDDSKATNVDAVVRALESFDVPVVLIMGGRSKGGDFSVLKTLIQQRVRKLILLGESKHEIMDALGHECRNGAEMAYEMEDAVLRAKRAAVSGDVVLLSPSGSSFDMYDSYARRGEDFCRIVRHLAGKS